MREIWQKQYQYSICLPQIRPPMTSCPSAGIEEAAEQGCKKKLSALSNVYYVLNINDGMGYIFFVLQGKI